MPVKSKPPAASPPTAAVRETKLRQVGSTVITVTVAGCTRCGTRQSSSWHVERLTFVMCGYDRTQIAIPLCDDCKSGRTAAAKEPSNLFAKGDTDVT